jgi:hypothetical protein
LWLAVDRCWCRAHVESGDDVSRRQLDLVDVAVGKAALGVAGVIFGEGNTKGRLLLCVRRAAGVATGKNDGARCY